MNERIKELAKQAGIKITPMIVDGIEYEYEDVDMDGSEDLAKFAELIVKECAEFVDSHEQVDRYGEAQDVVYGEDLLKHFGVKE